MVKWEILNVKENDFKLKLQKFFQENKNKWLWTIVRIPRSASGLGIRILKEIKTSSIDITPDELVDLLSFKLRNVNKLLVETMLPTNSFTSPNVVWYVHSNWNVEIFWATDQLLVDNIHQWNIYNPKNNEIYRKLKELSKFLLEQYYKKLWVVWYFGVDFLLVESTDLPDENKYFSPNFKANFNIDGKTYYAPIVEVNFRINGGMPLAWTQNLENINTTWKVVSIINTLEIKKDICVITSLKKANLLVDNHSDKNINWVLPVTVLPWKFQFIIISDSIEEMEKINKKVKNLLW